MRKEYDFSKGKRGKYFKKALQSSNIVIIEPALTKFFPNSKAVNTALKEVLKLAKMMKV